MKGYIQGLLQEGSTQRGVIWALGAFGIAHFSAEQAQAILAITMALAGAHGITVPDRVFRNK